MKITCVRPYHGFNVCMDHSSEFGAVYDESYNPKPDLPLVNAVSLIKDAGHDVSVIDANAERIRLDMLLASLYKHEPDIVILRVAMPSVADDFAAALVIKEHWPNAKLLLSGHVTAILTDWIEEECKWVDGVIIGELEGATQVLLENGPVLWAGHRGKSLKIRGARIDLNKLIPPRYELFPFTKYLTPEGRIIAYAQTSRGCLHRCSYCPYLDLYGRIRSREIDKVIFDLQYLSRIGIEIVQFRDALFTYNKHRTLKFSTQFKQAGIPIEWWCETRIDSLDAELVKAMAKGGCRLIAFGIEAASTEVLRNVNRHYDCTHHHTREMINIMKSEGIHAQGMFILGFPSDTRKSIEATIDLALNLNLDGANFNVFTPYPGSRYWHYMIPRSARITPEIFIEGKNHLPLVHNNLTLTELEEMAGMANKLFSLRLARNRNRI